MKLNKIIPAMAMGIAALMNTACSNIATDDRLIYVEPPTVERSVIIEDFTGQWCVNCPKAAEAIHQLQEQYGADNVIAVGLHGGPFSKKLGKPTPLYAKTADDLYTKFAVGMPQPVGMINRGAPTSNLDEWPTQVRENLAKVSYLKIEIESSKAKTIVTLKALDDISGYLNVWLTEDGIKSFQMDGGTKNENYIHNHVFRTSFTGLEGNKVTLASGESLSVEFSPAFNLDGTWNTNNMNVVAFVYDDTGVLQAAQAPLLKSEN